MSERKRIGLREVRALGPGEIAWDSGLPGFAARRQRGDTVSYVLKYRTSAGRQQRWHTIGRHGAPWTPETARAEALKVLGEVAKGADPASAKAVAKTAPTVAELAARFLAEHAEAKRKPRTAREYRRLFEKVIPPPLGRNRVADVTRQDIARLHHAKRATPTEANRALALLSVLSVLFTFAERQGERPDGSSPCRHVERFPQPRRERFLSADELARHGTRWRPTADRGEARLPDSKTVAKTIHLPPPALEVLAGLPRLEGNPYVLGGRRSTTFIEKPWRVIRELAGLRDVRLHDLRHAFASVAASAGMGLPIIGKMLGHTQAQTTQRYAHLASDSVKAEAAAVAGKIAAAMKGSPEGDDKVTPLRPQRA